MPTINRKQKYEPSVDYDRENQSTKYYNSKQWKQLRNMYIRHHPLCEMCLNRDISRPAQHVHHKKEFLKGSTDEERWKLLLDYDNLQSLCLDCHHKVHHNRK